VKYFAFLRAVNVTGRNIVRMSDLRELCTSLGFENVQTLLASGNVVFDAKRRPSEAKIAEAIRASSGPTIKVMLRSEAELRGVVERNPFVPVRDPSYLLVFFLDREPSGRIVYTGPETFHVVGREVYVDYVNGVGKSKLTSNLIERSLGVAGTARNWNTVTKLLALTPAAKSSGCP
jgi:uncharacterized protein (DUF1697 family)